MLFQYYATMSGLKTNQSIYWAVASSFPKATDVSKMIDKKLEIRSFYIENNFFLLSIYCLLVP